MNFRIREAKPEDIDLIFNFICELAIYEKLRDDVTATVELLYESLFIKKQAEVLIAELADEPAINVDSSTTSGSFTAIGFALFFHNFSTFKGRACLYLEDIFIKPEFRGKGYGKQMLKELAKIAVQRDCDRFEWSVLDWNEPSIKFYKSLGAIPMDQWTVYRLTGEPLIKMAE
ncbi:MAG: GNAT family N-acetyltransferase [Bacteroidales bacterium]|nr:GNAT family N-acetyltransferase [Bacteroidales bacterium]